MHWNAGACFEVADEELVKC